MPRGRPKGSKNKTTITKEEVNVKTKEGNFTPEEQETYAKMLKKNSVDTGINVNNIMSEADEVGTEDEDTSMEGVIENPPEAEKKNISPKVKKNNMPVCSRCGKEIKTSVYRLNLTYLTSTPPWRRNVADDKPCLCKECANGLSDLIDKWFIEGGAETKFPVPDTVGVNVSEAEDMTVVNNKFINKKSESKKNKEENKEEDFDF